MDKQQLPPLDHPQEVLYRQVRTEAMQLGTQIPEQVRDAIRVWHGDDHPWWCTARSEGQYCCLDYLFGDTAERWWNAS